MGRPRKVKPEEIEVKEPVNISIPPIDLPYETAEKALSNGIPNLHEPEIVKQSLNKEIPYYQKPKEGNYCKCGEEIAQNSFSGMCIDCFDAEFNFKNK